MSRPQGTLLHCTVYRDVNSATVWQWMLVLVPSPTTDGTRDVQGEDRAAANGSGKHKSTRDCLATPRHGMLPTRPPLSMQEGTMTPSPWLHATSEVNRVTAFKRHNVPAD